MARFDTLLSHGRIGPMALRNRMLLTSMGAGLAEADGTSGERIRAFHESHAQGGAALVTMGVVGVALPIGQNMINQPALSHDRYIPGIRSVAQSVQRHGAKFAVQLHFAGLVAVVDMMAGNPAWTPSIPEEKEGDMLDGFLPEEKESTPFFQMPPPRYRVMSTQDIGWLVGMFRDAAARARVAGVDGLEIHAGHGYLLSSFLSPATNKRTDAYGGSTENRARLLCEILRAVREGAGPDIALWCKIDAVERERAGGIDIGMAKETARLAEQAGAQAITVTAYHDSSKGVLHSASHTPDTPNLNVEAAAAIKAAVTVPVIVSGRIEPDDGEKLLRAGSADFVSMGRKLLADPELPRKIGEGRAVDILPCIYCYTCISAIYYGGSVRCAVNPRTAFEETAWLPPAAKPRRIVVVGGGPAGMEATWRLRARGHAVVLVEQGARLGGTLQFAAIAYAPNERILDWLRRQVEKSGAEIALNHPATPEALARMEPDAVVVATGARRDLPDIPGAHLPHVLSGDDLRALMGAGEQGALDGKTGLVTRMLAKAGSATGASANPSFLRAATRTWMPLGKRITIVGGELVGLELAEFLAERGRQVSVVDDAPQFGAGLQIVRRWRVLDTLRRHGVRLLPALADLAIERAAVTARDAEGRPVRIETDHVLIARGAHGDTALAEQLRAAGHEVHTIGDCRGVGYIEGAIRSAAELARML